MQGAIDADPAIQVAIVTAADCGVFCAGMDLAETTAIQQARPPARFSESPAAIRRLPPRLGEHTREILAEVGYSDADIDALVGAKAIGESVPV